MGVGILASQEIRKQIEEARIWDPHFDKSRIQPSSFEPTLGDEIYVLDPEKHGAFRPQSGESVYRSLLRLPRKERKKESLEGGYEIKLGNAYLVPLEQRLRQPNVRIVNSSPKSSLGRVFLSDRMLADFNLSHDEVLELDRHKEIMLWLLLEPLQFNLTLHPGLALNQLKFFNGLNGNLTPREIINEYEKNPILWEKNEDGEDVPAEHIVTKSGLRVHLDLEGRHTNGIVALRALKNPEPIDLSVKGRYNPEDYFEPMKAKNGELEIRKGHNFLLASKEILKFPPHISSELRTSSHIGFKGEMHQAGFIDNGFAGDLVFEPRSHETDKIQLSHGMPLSELELFKSIHPDKLYGTSIGSNYQGQIGPKTAKYFRPFDYKRAAKDYEKLDRIVLVQDARILKSIREQEEGFEILSDDQRNTLLNCVRDGFWHSRYDCEDDELVLQPIPYVVIVGPNNTVFRYVRAENIKDYGDERLFGKHSIGVGGHITIEDEPDFIESCLERELREEIKFLEGRNKPRLVGTLMAYDKPVDRVHFGVIYKVETNGDVKIGESALVSGELKQIDDIEKELENKADYETWSRILIPHLPEILKR